jgi:hypothetical protein
MSTVAIDQQFGRLTVTGVTPGFFSNRETGVNVECSCGTVKTLRKGALVHGNTRSCGCLLRETGREKQAGIVAKHTDPVLPSETPGVRPAMESILALLAEAGDKGMLVADIVRSFGEPAARSDRNRLVNSTLMVAKGRGRARRSETPERSPYYLRTLCYRWFITDAGRAYLISPPERKQTTAEMRQARRQEAGQRREAALALVKEQGLGPDTPRDIRDQAIAELTRAGVTSPVIGELFGISYQRVRQIHPAEAIPHCPSCSCKEIAA